jgi:hypothetical protein
MEAKKERKKKHFLAEKKTSRFDSEQFPQLKYLRLDKPDKSEISFDRISFFSGE